jgi:hypothetical protein
LLDLHCQDRGSLQLFAVWRANSLTAAGKELVGEGGEVGEAFLRILAREPWV